MQFHTRSDGLWFSAKINGAEYFSNWIGGIDQRRRRA